MAASAPTTDAAARHAKALLAALGMTQHIDASGDHPALGWRRAGLTSVTGRADGPGLVAPVALTSAADGTMAALSAMVPGTEMPSGAALLGERARLLGLQRQGPLSPNGTCRLISARGGCFALNLAREDDWNLVPALLGRSVKGWAGIDAAAATMDCDALVDQGRLLGLPIAADVSPQHPSAPFELTAFRGAERRSRRPLVIDFSSLWAGPLAGALLQQAGADVIKVESRTRPDGARHNHRHFFDLLNGGKASVALNFGDPADVRLLHRLVDAADIVIEASRPRALAALGLVAEQIAALGKVWVSITAHGRSGDAADWVGFGDDAAVAAGLSTAMARAWGEPLFAGDAIADPLTGMIAALAGWACWRADGGWLVSISMTQVVAHAMALEAASDIHAWQRMADADEGPLYPLRMAIAPGSPLGADNARTLARLGIIG